VSTDPPETAPLPEGRVWFYEVNAVRHGPLTLAQLIELLRSGGLEPRTPVWHPGLPGFEPALTALAPLRRKAQPGPPAPSPPPWAEPQTAPTVPIRPRRRPVVAAVALVGAIALCALLLSRPTPSSEPTPAAAPSAPAAAPASFMVEYVDPGQVRRHSDMVARLEEIAILDTVAEKLNGLFALDTPVVIATATCPEPNASFDPSRRRIELCSGFMRVLDLYARIGREHRQRGSGPLEDEILAGGFTEMEWEEFEQILHFALYHEAAHALIHQLDLGSTARSEEAADQLAFVLLELSYPPEDQQQGYKGFMSTWGASIFFGILGERFEEMDAAGDPHGLGIQRSVNLDCWNAGRWALDHDGKMDPVSLRQLPASRGPQCPAEYTRMRRAWDALLRPHLRTAPQQ
jgi:hypothetical protein